MKEKAVKFGIVCLVFLLNISLALAVIPNYITINGSALVSANPNIVLWLPLDEGSGNTTNDISQYNNDGTLFNSPTWSASCVFGNCLSFDGINDYIEIPNTNTTGSICDVGLGDSITAEGWIKTTQNPAARVQLWGCYGGSTYPTPNQFWSLFLEPGGKVSAWIRRDNNAATYSVYSNFVVNDGKWHHIVFLKDSSSLKLSIWVDGTKENEVSITDGNTLNNYPLRLAGFHWNRWYSGSLDDIRIWNISLTPEQIQNIYQKGAS